MVFQISKRVLILPSFSWFGEIKKVIEHFLNFFNRIFNIFGKIIKNISLIKDF